MAEYKLKQSLFFFIYEICGFLRIVGCILKAMAMPIKVSVEATVYSLSGGLVEFCAKNQRKNKGVIKTGRERRERQKGEKERRDSREREGGEGGEGGERRE
jgi:hypothetical protein